MGERKERGSEVDAEAYSNRADEFVTFSADCTAVAFSGRNRMLVLDPRRSMSSMNVPSDRVTRIARRYTDGPTTAVFRPVAPSRSSIHFR